MEERQTHILGYASPEYMKTGYLTTGLHVFRRYSYLNKNYVGKKSMQLEENDEHEELCVCV